MNLKKIIFFQTFWASILRVWEWCLVFLQSEVTKYFSKNIILINFLKLSLIKFKKNICLSLIGFTMKKYQKSKLYACLMNLKTCKYAHNFEKLLLKKCLSLPNHKNQIPFFPIYVFGKKVTFPLFLVFQFKLNEKLSHLWVKEICSILARKVFILWNASWRIILPKENCLIFVERFHEEF